MKMTFFVVGNVRIFSNKINLILLWTKPAKIPDHFMYLLLWSSTILCLEFQLCGSSSFCNCCYHHVTRFQKHCQADEVGFRDGAALTWSERLWQSASQGMKQKGSQLSTSEQLEHSLALFFHSVNLLKATLAEWWPVSRWRKSTLTKVLQNTNYNILVWIPLL